MSREDKSAMPPSPPLEPVPAVTEPAATAAAATATTTAEKRVPAAPRTVRPPTPAVRPARLPQTAREDPAAAAIARWSALRPMAIGIGAVAALVLGFGVWGATASISGAVVAPGQIEVEARRQVLQHPDGGVVGEILAKDGDRVDAGAVLLRLDDTLLRSELAIIEGQLFELMSRRGRLVAERDGKTAIAFDAELLSLAATRGDVAELMIGQTNLFVARRETRDREASQLGERQAQTRKQIEGAEFQLRALEKQLVLIKDELADQQTLLAKGLAQATRVSALQREEARLEGQVGEIVSGIAQSRGRIAEIEIEVLKIGDKLREEANTTLRDLEFREVDLRQKRIATLERLSRLDIRTPVKGIVYGNTVFAIRAVVRPAEPLMYVVPVDSALVITTRVEPINIDEVHVGQDARLRFSAFSSRTTPEIDGVVTEVSADAFVDEARGYSYFTARVAPKEGELAKLAGNELLPGMPVEAYIQTGERSALNYFLKPMADYFMKAFRED